MNELVIGQRLLIFVVYICGTENSEGSEDMTFHTEAIFNKKYEHLNAEWDYLILYSGLKFRNKVKND